MPLPLQVPFSEKGTKIAPQTHIQKFEILEISFWNGFHGVIGLRWYTFMNRKSSETLWFY